MQLQSPSVNGEQRVVFKNIRKNQRKTEKPTLGLPNDLHEFRHRQMLGHQKLDLIEQRQLLLRVKPLDNDWYLAGKLHHDHFDIGNSAI